MARRPASTSWTTAASASSRRGFAAGVVELYRGFLANDEAQVVHAYERWGFKNLTKDLVETLNIWAKFIYAPLLDDRVRTVADGIAPGHYGRREAFQLHQALKQKGPVRVPREFVFMDRAAIGLGSVFLHLGARMNFHSLYDDLIADFDIDALAARQAAALERPGSGRPARHFKAGRKKIEAFSGLVRLLPNAADRCDCCAQQKLVSKGRASSRETPMRKRGVSGFDIGREDLTNKHRGQDGRRHDRASAGHPDMDYAEHEATYGLFLKLTKYGLVIVILILIFLAYMWG